MPSLSAEEEAKSEVRALPGIRPGGSQRTDHRLSRSMALNQETADLFAEHSLEGVFQRTVDVARDLVDALYGVLRVRRHDEGGVQLYTSGLTPEACRAISPLLAEGGPLAELTRQGRSLRVEDLNKGSWTSGPLPEHPPIKSLLAVPIPDRSGPLSELYIFDRRDGRPFSTADERLILMLARHSAVAVANAQLYEQMQGRLQQLISLRHVSAAVTSELDLQRVLRLVAQKSMELTGSSGAAIGLLDPQGGLIRYSTAVGRDAEAIQGLALPLANSLGGWALQNRQTAKVDDLASDPRVLPSVVGTLRARSAIFVPLFVRGEPLGTLVALDRDGGQPFRPEDVELLEAFGHQAAVAINNARLYDRVQRLAVLEERERIARDLHDGTNQAIYAVGLGLEYALELVETAPSEARAHIQRAIRDLNAVMLDLRAFIMGLQVADGTGDLRQLLAQLVEEFRARYPLPVALDVASDAGTLSGEVARHHVVQIVREALSNAVRHASPQRVQVIALRAGPTLRIGVADDGRGFDPQAPPGPEHRGLRNMRDRALALGGQLFIDSSPGQGTRVVLELPVLDGGNSQT